MHTLTRVVAVAATLIIAAATVPVAGSAAASASASASASYKLTYAKQPNGNQIVLRWNPCREHTYKVNLAAVPSAYRRAVLAETHAAVRTLTAQSGILFKYKGATREVPRVGSAARQSAEVIIAYTTPAKTNYLLSGPTAGLGGQTLLGAWRPAVGNSYTTAIVKAMLVIDTPQMLRAFKPGFGAGLSRGNLLLHELGHVAGLDHINRAGLLMNHYLNGRLPKGYATGDRAGLARVGRRAGCLNGF